MSFSRSDVSAKKHMARVSDLYRERVRSIKTVLFFIVSVSLLSGETVPTIFWRVLGSWPNQSNAIINCMNKAHYEINIFAWHGLNSSRNTFWLELKFMLHDVGLPEIMMRMMMTSDNDEENGPLNGPFNDS